MKTLNYVAVILTAIVFSLSFNTISSGAQQNSDCPDGNGTCILSATCSGDNNSSGVTSMASCDDCENCNEACSSNTGSMNQSGGSDNDEQTSDVLTVNDCSADCSKDCSK